jgi:hypothetical protein
VDVDIEDAWLCVEYPDEDDNGVDTEKLDDAELLVTVLLLLLLQLLLVLLLLLGCCSITSLSFAKSCLLSLSFRSTGPKLTGLFVSFVLV